MTILLSVPAAMTSVGIYLLAYFIGRKGGPLAFWSGLCGVILIAGGMLVWIR